VYLSAPTTATLSDSGQFLVMDDGTTSDYLRANLEIGASGDAEVAGALIQDVNTTTTNLGTFTVDGTGSIRLTSGEDVFTNDASVVNNGAVTLTANASWTQNAGAAVQSGNPVEIFNSGLLDDETGGGSFYLIDAAGLEGTIPAGQTVTAEAFPGHNANVSLVGTTVTNDGTLVLDEPSTGQTSYLSGPATLVNNGQLTTQTEESPASTNYLRANLTNDAGATVTVASGTLLADSNTTTLNHGMIEVAADAGFNFSVGEDVLVNASDGTLEPDLASASRFGTFNFTGDATFTAGGTMWPNLVGGYAPPVGSVFNVMTGTNGGTFTTVANGFIGDYLQPHIIAVQRDRDSTATALGAVPSSSTFGQQVTLTATITDGEGPIGNPTGTVTFYDDGTEVGTAPVSTSAGETSATFTTQLSAPLPVGTDQLTASYGGDSNFKGSTSSPATPEAVSEATPTVTLQPASQTSTYNSSVTITATVAGPAGVTPGPTGTVTFTYGAIVLGSPTVTTSGGVTSATLTTSALPGGSDQVTAEYNGDGNYDAALSAAPASITVAPLATTTALNASPNPVATGATETLTATITPSVGADPTGTVRFTAAGGADVLGTAPVSTAAGTTAAELELALSAGTYQVVATYSGDGNFDGSASSPAVDLTVTAPTCSANPTVRTNPASRSVTQPAAASFTAAATDRAGCHTLSVQWQVSTSGGATWSNDTTDAGSITNTLTISPTSTSQSGNEYRAVFSDEHGSADSNPAALTVNPSSCPAIPTITLNPATATGVVAPGLAPFSAAATNPAGCGTMTIQWQESVRSFSGTIGPFANIPGANSTTYTVNPTALIESGDQFRALFTNAAGTATSSAGSLFVNAPPSVTSVLPNHGNAGAKLLITGTNFNPVSTTVVLFGTVPAASFSVVSPIEITAVAPNQASGTTAVAVTVHNGPLVSSLVSGDVFTY
jgi:hypothetical protein